MRRVAALGSARASMKQIPWNDTGLEIWGLAWRIETLKRCDMGFEIHRPPWRPEKVGPDYVKRLASHKFPIVMYDTHPDVPNSVQFDHDAGNKLGGDYFMSSVAYMIAHAIIEGVDELQIYGVDMVTSGEYEYQRPNAEYWLGVARGHGINVIVADGSALLRGNFRYGETRIGEASGAFSQDFIQGRIDDYDEQLKKHAEQLQTYNGGRQECRNVVGVLDEIRKKHPSKGLDEAFQKMIAREAQYGEQMKMLEAQANTTNGAKQEAAAMLDFQAHYDRGGVVPGAGLGAINAARIDSGTTPGDDKVLPIPRSGEPVGDGPGSEADAGGNGLVQTGPAQAGSGAEASNGNSNGKPNGKARGKSKRAAKGRKAGRGLVHPVERAEGAGQEGAEESAGPVA